MDNTFYKNKMIDRDISFEEREERFNQFIVSEYLKYGSVDEVFSKNDYNLPISYPQVHRILNKWNIVKSVGPNSKLSEAICFLVLLSDKKIPVERLYKSIPPSFKTSLSTLHRILHNIKEDVIRRVGSALVITSEEDREKILIGDDISTPRLNLGKPFGSISLPMGYSKKDEDSSLSILRILQQEVFTKKAIEKKIPNEIIPQNTKPFMFVDIADVRVSVYNLILPKDLFSIHQFSSYKLNNFRSISIDGLSRKNENFRTGLTQIGLGYKRFLSSRQSIYSYKPELIKSEVNLELAQLALEFVE